MFLFAMFCSSEIYANDAYIRKKLAAGQTFVVETTGTRFNNTIFIPNLEGIDVTFTQGNQHSDEQHNEPNINGIVGYGKHPVRAFVKANKNVTLEAYVKGTNDVEQVSSKIIIFTDPTLVVKNDKEESININGFFPESVSVVVKKESQNKTRHGYSKSSQCEHDIKQILSYYIPKTKIKYTIFVSPLSSSINSPRLYALVHGIEQGTTFRLGNISCISKYVANEKQKSCYIDPTRKSLGDDDELVNFEMSNNYGFAFLFIAIVSILVCIAVILYKKISKEWMENKAIADCSNIDSSMQIESKDLDQRELHNDSLPQV